MKRIILFFLICLLCNRSFADEGMWPLPLLNQRLSEMRALGLKLQDYDIYNPDSSSIKDAILQFGGGCTGEIISPEGLVLTNHHCGYNQIQAHSSIENDYLTDGFWAMSRREELPCPGLKVTFIEKIEDVTEYVKKKLEADGDSNSMNFLSPTYLNELAKKLAGDKFTQENPFMDVEIKAFYGGNQYFMFTKKIYADVRLVGAPPSSIGKFGADTDNWMWPRHTGDFSLFRVYADENGQPGEYAETNQPLRPKRWLNISLKGVEPGDFAMMIGFPGRTNQYYTSWEVAERRDIDNRVRIHFREIRQEVMLNEMLNDPVVRIQYAGKYASSTNAYKNAIGTNWAINHQGFEASKRNRQEQLYDWSKKREKHEYIQAIDEIERIVHERSDLRLRSWVLNEAIIRGIAFSSIPVDTDHVLQALNEMDKSEAKKYFQALKTAYEPFFASDYNPLVEKKISKVMLKEYMKWIPLEKQPEYFISIHKKYGNDTDRYVDDVFKNSIFGSIANFNRFFARPSVKSLLRDPMILFSQSVQDESKRLAKALEDYNLTYAKAHRAYIKGTLEMERDHVHFPDANLSIRLSYGQVNGYQPKDAVNYFHQTTLDGVMQKEEPDNWEFVVPAGLKDLYAKGDFGRYGSGDKMPVCFCASTHSTGGNSGSPVLNATGDLIGINFDRNWEGVGGDIQYLPDYQRSIIVDIRYVLFIIDKYAKAGYLIDEMTIIE